MDLDSINLEQLVKKANTYVSGYRSQENVSDNDIAIIGINARIADADNVDEFWENLITERTSIRHLPKVRKSDVNDFLLASGKNPDAHTNGVLQEAFLNEVDKFDYRFFGISRQEANLMDPNQRLFLQSAWSAIEEAGYGGNNIEGTNTGVFVGMSNDFGEDYARIVAALAPDAPEISIVGNIKSVIASRISYLLNLTGPSMLIDTACSSALVALHLACDSILRDECKIALVGTVKTHLIPVLADDASGVGTREIRGTFSSHNRTRTFDQSSDGMSLGEGVIVLMVKKLSEAINDRDHIHAVVKGSAINQDGKTVGLTAPSTSAQSKVVLQAHKKASIDPASVSYIEAHGTATQLGDPVEVGGISSALSKSVPKKQFCGIGSVKTNIGHLDNAAGLASLVKVVMAMKHQTLPASLYFNSPNNNIEFIDSPVYVVDSKRKWDAASSEPYVAGISAFGLSGTNCHTVLQSFQCIEEHAQQSTTKYYFLPISAKTEESLKRLVSKYLKFLDTVGEALVLENMCFTAATGRWHHRYRIAIIFTTKCELREALQALNSQYKTGICVNYDITRLDDADNRKNIESIATHYCEGEDVDWQSIYPNNCHKLSLPTYCFERDRCWVQKSEQFNEPNQYSVKGEDIQHPLIDALVTETLGLKLFETQLSPKTHWELYDHKVMDSYVLPGTCYIEMAIRALGVLPNTSKNDLVFSKFQFISPCTVNSLDDSVVLQTKVISSDKEHKVEIVSRGVDNAWVVHAEAVSPVQVSESPGTNHTELFEDESKNNANEAVSLQFISARCTEEIEFSKQEEIDRGLFIGDRWNEAAGTATASLNKREFLFNHSLPMKYACEINDYFYHPALFDTAINAANHIIGDGSLYLPLAYQNLKIRRKLPESVFIHVKLHGKADSEVVQFSIDLIDSRGTICASVDRYSVKKVDQRTVFETKNNQPAVISSYFEPIPFGTKVESLKTEKNKERNVLYIQYGDKDDINLIKQIESYGFSVIRKTPKQVTLWLGSVRNNGESTQLETIVISVGGDNRDNKNDVENIVEFYHLLNRLCISCFEKRIKIIILTNLNHIDETSNCPVQAAFESIASVAAKENPQHDIACSNVSQCSKEFEAQSILSLINSHYPKARYDFFKDQLFQETFKETTAINEAEIELKDNGIYVISGGVGALGLELVEYLAKSAEQKRISISLALFTRRHVPEIDFYSAEKITESKPTIPAKNVNRLLKLQSQFVEVMTISTSISDKVNVQDSLRKLRENHGEIRGVFHMAGVAGDGFMRDKPLDKVRNVLLPKIEGLQILNELTQHDPIDYFVTYSSINSVVAEPGQADYSAANRYMDQLIINRRLQGKPGLSIRWPAWEEVGMAVEYNAISRDDVFNAIPTSEALSGMSYCLVNQQFIPEVVILATVNKDAAPIVLAESGISFDGSLVVDMNLPNKSDVSAASGIVSTVSLSGDQLADDVSQAIGDIWGRVLQESELDTKDEFNNVGGNSILTAQLYKELNAVYPDTLDMADLFTQTTIESQAFFVREKLGLENSSKQSPVQSRSGSTEADSVVEDELEILARLASGELSIKEAGAIFS